MSDDDETRSSPANRILGPLTQRRVFLEARWPDGEVEAPDGAMLILYRATGEGGRPEVSVSDAAVDGEAAHVHEALTMAAAVYGYALVASHLVGDS